MSEPIIKIENLGKSYFIGHEKQGNYTALRDVIADNIKGFRRNLNQIFNSKNQPILTGSEIQEFWALKEVSFEVNRGDAIGIIGRNGAGKSTLLKLLSRITEPTKGRIEIKGRVASLLEVGTGFHPELTGRENIFLNGAILGMSRQEIKLKFDEIVDFSGVETFLDTPVKRYSSGMYVRLAFSVAAHLEPDILVVDEVLAVGDAEFQKKCLGKMNDVSHKEGRTVLFVSHNMSAILSLCKKAYHLDAGLVLNHGECENVINKYLNHNKTSLIEKSNIDININRPWGRNGLQILKVELRNNKGEITDILLFREPIYLTVHLFADEKIKKSQIQIRISQLDGTQITYSNIIDDNNSFYDINTGNSTFTFEANPLLMPGNYSFNIFIFTQDAASSYDSIIGAYPFQVVGKAYTGNDFIYKPNMYINTPAKWLLDDNIQSSL